MSVTTGKGDEGYTSLLNGERVRKNDLRVKLLGDMDELSSHIGLIKGKLTDSRINEELTKVQKNLSIIMSQVADGNALRYPLRSEELSEIEEAIAFYQKNYINNTGFIMPGVTETSSLTDVCRSIARRVERSLIDTEGLWDINSMSRKYLNRLSDYFYVCGRYVDFVEEITNLVVRELKESIPVTTKETELNLGLVKKAMDKIEAKAEEMRLPVVIAICNKWGSPIAVHFMDGALPGSFQLSLNKAFTVASFRMSTMELGKLAGEGKSLQGIHTTDNRIVVFGGGRPIKLKDEVVGAIGVSGGSDIEDDTIAKYGAYVISEMLG